jgi:hypothetical protein
LRVELGERLGIHQGFVIHGEGDLREDVGALAAQEGWAIRELSSHKRSLEDVFAQLVAGNAVALADPKDLDESSDPVLDDGGGLLQLHSSSAPSANPASEAPPAKKTIYSLNPFDQGTTRDLGAPMEIDDPGSSDSKPDDPEARS